MKRHFFFILPVMLSALFACNGHRGDDNLKIITLNLRYDNPGDSINSWPNRAVQVKRFIEQTVPDIIGMQEVMSHQYSFLDSVLTGYSSVGAGRDDGLRGGEINPVFYKKDRFDMVRNITFWLSDTPGFPGSKAWGSSLPRIVTWLELVSKNTHKHFFFFNTHFAHDSDSARVMSAELLLDTVPEISGDFPFIITGDFNMPPESKGYSILTGPDEKLSILRDSYFVSGKKPQGPAYTFNGFSDKPGSGRIDYIFVKNGIDVLEHKTIPHKEGKIFISDHWPVETVVEF